MGLLAVVRHRPLLLVAMAACATLPAAALHVVGTERVDLGAELHFFFVAIGAGTAAAASIGLTVVGARRRDGRTVLMSTAFSTMAALLMIHGLATPGMIVPGPNGVVAFAGAASLPVGAAILALTALPGLRRPRDMRPLLWLQGTLAAGLLALGGLGLTVPSLVPRVPETGGPSAITLMVVGSVLFAVLVHRALKTFALTHRAADLVVAVGCVWLAVGLVPQLLIGFGTVGFYFGHVLELLGIALVAIPVLLDLRGGGRASRPLVGDLSGSEIVCAEEAYLGPRVRALLLSLERKDTSTERHTRRVALLAVRVGEELRVPPAALRHLAVGGLLHDIGKLAVAEAILTKPGSLTDEEFDAIKRHPGAGLALLEELGGFPDEVLSLVHEHHERLDGSGYPRALAGPEIGMGPRILAVCDVYDALTSDRVYRDAWSPAEALALLRSEGYDGRCVHALERVLDRAGAGSAAERPRSEVRAGQAAV